MLSGELLVMAGEPAIFLGGVSTITALLLWREGCVAAANWGGRIIVALLFIVASKLIFEFGGFFWASIGLYSISSHAMFVAAVFPLLSFLVGRLLNPTVGVTAFVIGVIFSVCAGASLVEGLHHTIAETLCGLLIGLAIGIRTIEESRLNPRSDGSIIWAGSFLVVMALLGATVDVPMKQLRRAVWEGVRNQMPMRVQYFRLVLPGTGWLGREIVVDCWRQSGESCPTEHRK